MTETERFKTGIMVNETVQNEIKMEVIDITESNEVDQTTRPMNQNTEVEQNTKLITDANEEAHKLSLRKYMSIEEIQAEEKTLSDLKMAKTIEDEQRYEKKNI